MWNAFKYLFRSSEPGSHMPPTYLRFSRRLQLTIFGDLLVVRRRSLAYSMARNANRIDAIFNSFIRNMDRVVLLACQFSLDLVLVIDT